jgi:hypothetical protein
MQLVPIGEKIGETQYSTVSSPSGDDKELSIQDGSSRVLTWRLPSRMVGLGAKVRVQQLVT